MTRSTFDEVLEAIENLPADEQADLIDVMRKRLSDRGRQRILNDVRDGHAEFDRGEVKPTSAEDLAREIES